MFAKIRLQLHSTVHVSGVEKYLPLRSADHFRFDDSFRFAALGPSVASLCHPWFTTTNLSYRFPIFETTTCRTTSEQRSKRRQKITRKALCPPPAEPHKKLKPTRRHNNDPSHLHLKQHAEVPQCRVEHAVKSENLAAAAHWKEKDRNTNSSLHSHPVWLGMEKVTLDAKHNLNARFINNMEKVLLMLNTT